MPGWIASALLASTLAQPPGGGFPGGPGGQGGPGGPGDMFGATRKLIPEFDKDKDGKLNATERAAARKSMAENLGGGRRGPGGPGGPPGGMGGRGNEPTPGPKVAVGDAKSYTGKSLYDPSTLRTLFINFENKTDWEKELEAFYHTDVEVPCTLTVDGKVYKDVGVHFRGSSSYFGVRSGSKRSLNLSMDFGDSKQRLLGSKTLNLLNGHDDPSLLSSALYSHISAAHIPTPAVNFVKIVINGESWGIYSNVQQFDKEFLQQHYKTTKGSRWKVKGSPMGRGGLEYMGEDIAAYQRVFEIKSKDEPEAWKKLINLCKVINTTPADKLEAALTPILDVDSLLWFLACDISLINCDGYWIRASDFTLYLDDKDKFHIVPHDMNECFRTPMGPGMGGGPGGGGFMIAMPRPGEVLPSFVADTLNLTAEQKKKLADLQKDVDGQLTKMLTAEQKKQLDDMKNAAAMFMGGPGGGGPGGGFPGGPGGPGGGAGGGLALDPLTGLNEERKPLRSKLLQVPKYRTQYLKNVYVIANEHLDWKNLGPVVANFRTLLDAEVKADTKKLDSYESFASTTADTAGQPRGREMAIRAFADQRRKALLENAEVKKAAGVK